MILSFFLISMALLPALYAGSMEDEGSTCTLVELHACLQSLQSVTQSNDLMFVTTRKELTALCSKLQSSVGCVDEHMKNCFSPTQTKVFNQVVAGARQFLLELCVEGPIQETYLKHSSCYKNVSLSEEKCAPKYRQLIHLSENVDEQRNVDEGLRESCCAFNDFVLCKYEYVRKDCGQEAAIFLEQHLDRISSPLIHEHCAHYTYATDSCVPTATAPETRAMSLAVIFVVSAVLVRLKFGSL
ncbi:hypothetical protein JTE90_008238 [Oedothorax gibbosus]|uniref:Uncharacterized protein n=1 Tax=Oedothorax gibbosus TaxID=931172 RepID=A0AAV6UMB1_9ARAC|nr:hypothetical protein JTE90_008238 [Oedothorax gibbosus]